MRDTKVVGINSRFITLYFFKYNNFPNMLDKKKLNNL